jgi:hypothetical protein
MFDMCIATVEVEGSLLYLHSPPVMTIKPRNGFICEFPSSAGLELADKQAVLSYSASQSGIAWLQEITQYLLASKLFLSIA